MEKDHEDAEDLIRATMRLASQVVRAGREPLPPDEYDEIKLPFGAPPGQNRAGMSICPFCGKPPTLVPKWNVPAFLFRDVLSAQEHTISGLCQACQDETFGRGDKR